MTYEAVKDILIPVVTILMSVVIAYFTATYTVQREYNHGRLRLLELTRRYFINVLNAFDPGSNQIKQDELSKRMYMEELRSVLKELGELIAHPYFATLIVKYPLLSKALILTRREIVEHEFQTSFSVNSGTMTEFYRLHQILQKDLPKKTNAEVDKTIGDLASALQLKDVDERVA